MSDSSLNDIVMSGFGKYPHVRTPDGVVHAIRWAPEEGTFGTFGCGVDFLWMPRDRRRCRKARTYTYATDVDPAMAITCLWCLTHKDINEP